MLPNNKLFLLLTVALLTGCSSDDSEIKRQTEQERQRKELVKKQRMAAELGRQLENRLSSHNDSSSLGSILTHRLNEFEVKGIPIFHIFPKNQVIIKELLQGCLNTNEVKKAVMQGNTKTVSEKLLETLKSIDSKNLIFSLTPPDKFIKNTRTHKYNNPEGERALDPNYMRFVRLKIGDIELKAVQTAESEVTRFGDKLQVEFYNNSYGEVAYSDWSYKDIFGGNTNHLTNKQTGEYCYSFPFMESIKLYSGDGTLTSYGEALKYIFHHNLVHDEVLSKYWSSRLSSQVPNDASDHSLRNARTNSNGRLDASALYVNNSSGTCIELETPLYIQLKGNIDNNKKTDAVSGSFAYRCGNTLLGIVQGYANNGKGFEAESSQVETSLMVSQSFGTFFIEGQAGRVSVAHVHSSDWHGYRSQLKLGVDTKFISPFVQVGFRQLNRNDSYKLNETSGYIGLEMVIADLQADTYSFSTHLSTKIGYCSKDWLKGSAAYGSTSEMLGSLEWSGAFNINGGASLTADLNLNITRGSTFGIQASLTR